MEANRILFFKVHMIFSVTHSLFLFISVFIYISCTQGHFKYLVIFWQKINTLFIPDYPIIPYCYTEQPGFKRNSDDHRITEW